MAKSSNPVLSKMLKKYQGLGYTNNFNYPNNFGGTYGFQNGPGATIPQLTQQQTLTYDHIISRTAISLGLIVLSAVADFMLFETNPGLGMLLGLIGMLAAVAIVFVDMARNVSSKTITISYAIAEGLGVGCFTQIIAKSLPGSNSAWIVAQAFLGTVGVFVAMLVLYSKRVLRATPRFNKIVAGFIVGILFLSLGSMLISLFAGQNLLYTGGPIAIIFSLVCIGVAAASLVTDFDRAEALVAVGADQSESWRIAFGLSVTLVWIYTEILRLLSYINRSN